MADRKVLIKYFPKNFDHQRIVKRGRGKDKLMNVRNMLPMSLRCNTCGNYLYIGTKFNMRMEICNDETYLDIKVFRFYFKCTICYAEISFKTDPKNHDYVVELGGTRNYEAIKDAQHAEKHLKEMKKNEKAEDSMKYLENRSYDSKREMELMEALDDIKNQNKRKAVIDPEDLLKNMIYQEEVENQLTELQEMEINQQFQELKAKRLQEQLSLIDQAPEIEQNHEENNEKPLATNTIFSQKTTSSKSIQKMSFHNNNRMSKYSKKIHKPDAGKNSKDVQRDLLESKQI